MTPRILLLPLLAAMLLQGCASHWTADPGPAAPSDAETVTEASPQAPAAEPRYRPFPAETLYALLVAEMAGSRERYDIALGNYMQQAHKTRDPGVAARATHIARFLNARQAALNTALLWVDISPQDLEARFIAASELIQAGRLQEAMTHADYLHQHDSAPLYQSIAGAAAQATDTQREQLLQQYLQLHEEHPGDLELTVALGLLYQQQGQLENALELARKALSQDRESVPAAILEARLLHQLERPQEAIGRLAGMLKQHPDNTRLRLQYARLLAATDLAKAQDQFARLLQESPGDPELLLSLALINLERDQLDAAREYFTELLEVDRRRSTAHYYLGQISERQQAWDEALQHYLLVAPGPDFLPALLRTTDILVRAGELDSAHQRLAAARQQFPGQAEQLYLLEAEVLNRYRHLQQARTLLDQALEQHPDNVSLLYSRAMIHEQLDRLDLLEQDLRSILKYDPNNATALNALGYTLTDRTQRHEEALELISRALQLQPDDPAIIDSMGWVQYHLGNYEEAELRLRQAFKSYPDHEIAAHLGEVLWVTGQRQEAREVWQQGIELDPDNDQIPAVMERLGAD